MFDIRIDVPDDRHIIARLVEFPAALRARLFTVISRLTSTLYTAVLAAEPYRTGKLRSLTKYFVDQTDDYVRGRVRVLGTSTSMLPFNVGAAALEYGAHHVVSVAASKRLDAFVSAYNRRANITGLAFLRDPEQSIAAEAGAGIRQAVTEATQVGQ